MLILKRFYSTRALEAFIADLDARRAIKLRSGYSSMHNVPCGIYGGIDPSADSLHVGNLVLLNALFKAAVQFNIKSVAVIGDFTAPLGDPSFRNEIRNPLTIECLAQNTAKIRSQIQKLFESYLKVHFQAHEPLQETSHFPFKMVNNSEWMQKMTVSEYFALAARPFKVGNILARDCLKMRASQKYDTLTYGELSYQLLQAIDFWHLFRCEKIGIQIGGSDQWGNIVSGLELISKSSRLSRAVSVEAENRSNDPEAIAICTPLLQNSSGVKFGKTSGDAIWLAESRTVPFDFYQSFVRLEDAVVEAHLNLLTALSAEKIQQLMEAHDANPKGRIPHTALACYMTRWVHGDEVLQKMDALTAFVYGTQPAPVPPDLKDALVRNKRMWMLQPQMSSASIVDFICATGACVDRDAANTLLAQNAVTFDGLRVVDPTVRPLNTGKSPSVHVLRVGKREHFFFQITQPRTPPFFRRTRSRRQKRLANYNRAQDGSHDSAE